MYTTYGVMAASSDTFFTFWLTFCLFVIMVHGIGHLAYLGP